MCTVTWRGGKVPHRVHPLLPAFSSRRAGLCWGHLPHRHIQATS